MRLRVERVAHLRPSDGHADDPAILLDDIDPATVAEKVFAGAFQNNGQVCSAIKRVYVPEALYGDVVDALAAKARSAKVGNGMDEGVLSRRVEVSGRARKQRGRRPRPWGRCAGGPADLATVRRLSPVTLRHRLSTGLL